MLDTLTEVGTHDEEGGEFSFRAEVEVLAIRLRQVAADRVCVEIDLGVAGVEAAINFHRFFRVCKSEICDTKEQKGG